MAASTNATQSGPRWIAILQGVAGIILGILLIARPGMTLTLLLTFVGIYWVVSGVLSLIRLMLGNMEAHWMVYLLHGVLAILVGFVLIAYPVATAVIVPSMLMIGVGILGIVVGVFAIVQAMRGAGWGMAGIGAVSVLTGLLLLSSPFLAVAILGWVIAIGAIVGGGFAIYDGFRHGGP